MGLLDKVRKNLKKEDVEIEEENEECECREEFFIFYDKKWVISPFMEEIKKGDVSKIPIECMLTHYILKNELDCYYISLMNNETGDEYGIWQFDWHGGEMEQDEKLEPEFREISLGMGAVDCAKFLRERLEIGYDIYIEERIEVET